MENSITQSELKSMLDYNPETGLFTRLTSPNGKNKIGEIAGSIDGNGYVKISVKSRSYTAHRLAWLYMYGEFPVKHLDHINGNKVDNRIDNLREVTVCENMKNKTKPKHNTSGKTGVKWNKQIDRWTAQITVDKKRIHLGTFKTIDEAIDARIDAEKLYGFTTREEQATDKVSEVYSNREFEMWKSGKERTKKSLVQDIYNNQLSNSKARGHRKPEYTKKELYEWCMSQEIFHRLFAEWKASGEEKRLIPSVDRKCDDVHYCMNNIQLMTFGENEDKYKAMKLANKTIVDQIEVEQYSLDGEYLATYPSMAEATRQTGAKAISLVCDGKRKHSGGYIWIKKENINE